MAHVPANGKCAGSGMSATHSDASYVWRCPVCQMRLASRNDNPPTVRPHRPGGYRLWAKRVKQSQR